MNYSFTRKEVREMSTADIEYQIEEVHGGYCSYNESRESLEAGLIDTLETEGLLLEEEHDDPVQH